MLTINNVATANDYSPALTLESQRGGGKLVLLVANASVILKLRPLWDKASSAAQFGDEILVPPSTVEWGNISGVSIRSAIAGSPARIIAQLYEPGDVLGGAGTAFTSTLLASGGTSTSGLIAGAIIPYAGTTPPAGFVLCDGATYDGTNASYAALFGAIGVTYGGVPSAFAVPDLRGRVIVGIGTHVDVDALGDNDGSALADRRPKHRHTVNDPTHRHGMNNPGNTATGGAGARATGAGNILFTEFASTGITVGNDPVNDALDTPPYLVLNYLISLG